MIHYGLVEVYGVRLRLVLAAPPGWLRLRFNDRFQSSIVTEKREWDLLPNALEEVVAEVGSDNVAAVPTAEQQETYEITQFEGTNEWPWASKYVALYVNAGAEPAYVRAARMLKKLK